MKQKEKLSDKSGFTILELLIASAVFSLVLMGALAGFLQIGKMFYKGTSLTATQENAKQTLNDVSDSVQLASSISGPLSSNGYDYYCVGKARYTFKIGRRVDSTQTNFSSNTSYGIVKDTLPGPDACAPPCPVSPGTCPSGHTRWSSPRELVGDNMRVQVFRIQNPGSIPDYYTIDLVVAFGEDDLLQDFAPPADPAAVKCRGSTVDNQHYCAIARYSTSLKKGMDL